ncbi:response regulator [Lyngbya sp. PCC 8106]|uniref:response regulator n=1 Tax=Lyngbya sp. (strain PCC 8106) TaxID=313612 RepID=UPI0000EAD182|nr:response regulator [Lyngbya sp. PCC 8106]EAW38252.1 Response regulator receiver domain protein (CheY) [Lyngbya sp. PCC 8106]
MTTKSLTSLAHQSVKRKPYVLAVDDNQDNLILIGCVLENLGYPYLSAGSSQEALSLLQHYQPKLILLDIVLPDIDGLQLLRQIRGDQRIHQTTIVAVTGLALGQDRQRLLAAGFDDYLSKPYLLSDLEALVCRYLTQSNCNLSHLRCSSQICDTEIQK